MKLDLSESQVLLRDVAVGVFQDESTPARIRAAEKTGGFDKALWKHLGELGITSMRAATSDNERSSLLEAAIIAEEAGRHLASVPLIEAIVTSALLQQAGAPQALLTALKEGAVSTLALRPLQEHETQPIPNGAIAEIIVAMDGEELVTFRFSKLLQATPNIAAMPLALFDPFAAAAAERIVLASGNQARQLYEAAIEEWKLLTAAAIAGLGQQALQMAAAYSVERIQFGKPIGTFQGIAHPLADSATDIEGAQLLVWRAIAAIAESRPDAAASVSMAYWWATEAAGPALTRAVRTYGGYGLSLEYDIQLYYRRAKYLSLIAGDPQHELDTLADRLWGGKAVALPGAGDIGISFSFGAKAEAYAAELRAFVEANMTPEVEKKKHHSTSGHHPGFHKKLAQAGHAYPDIKVEGREPHSRYEVMAAAPLWEDLNWTRTPVAVTEFVANMCQLWSTPEAKQEILPQILSGDALGCLGFSEPSSGSDVFGARFGAARDGDGWLMNGQKMFTTNAHNASYILMLTRTDTSGKKHEGLTMFIMPLNLPGVEIHPVYTLQDERTNIVYWSDVKIADKYRIGDVGDGARVMASALGFEHGGAGYHAAHTAMLKHAVAWSRKTQANAYVPINDPNLRRTLARAAARSEVAEVLCRRQIWADVEGIHNPSYGPMAKMFSTEAMYTDASAIVEAAAPFSLIRGHDHDLDIVEVTMRRAIAMTIYGGSSEVHRSLIAEKFLGMPKSRG